MSNFKAVKFSIYPKHMLKEDTRIKTPLCNEWQKSQLALLIFEFFLITFSHLNVAWCYKVVPNLRQIIVLGEDGTCKYLIRDELQDFCLSC